MCSNDELLYHFKTTITHKNGGESHFMFIPSSVNILKRAFKSTCTAEVTSEHLML